MSWGSRFIAAGAIARSLAVPFERPDRVGRAVVAAALWGRGIASLAAAAAARSPSTVALIDDDGAVTYEQLWHRAHAVAHTLGSMGVDAHSTVGVLALNHQGFVEQVIATSMTGANLVLLNPGFAGPQLAGVVVDESIDLVLYDDEFAAVVEGCGAEQRLSRTTLESLSAEAIAQEVRVRPPRGQGRIVLLTSGTTGRPKGAVRHSDPNAAEGVGALLERVPLRARDVQVVAAPMFHAWGFSHLLLGMARSATTVVHRKFQADAVLGAVEQHRARVLVVVPVMLQRMLELGSAALEDRDLSPLAVVAVSGSALPGPVVVTWTQRVGPTLYNTYGSTEVALASIATPADLERSSITVGRPVIGARVEVLDPDRQPVPVGVVGEIFVGTAARFEGYTSGEGKEAVRGMLSSGDLGHFDDEGLLYVDGRADDMVVSGGENLFPGEVEDLLLTHRSIADVVVIGVPDEEFGQVLSAHVVLRDGHELSGEEVRDFVRERLARFKVPKHVWFTEELPRTTSGKPLRRELPDHAPPES